MINNTTVSNPDTGVKGSNPLPVQSGPGVDPTTGIILTRTANLATLLPIPWLKTQPCTPKYLVYSCGCGRRLVPSSCMSLDCPTCAPWVTRRRSQAVFNRLIGQVQYKRRKKTFPTVIYSVFTVPISHRERYYSKPEWQRCRKKIWNVLKEHFGALYGVEASHPIGDNQPEVFSPHLNFLWVQKNGWNPFISVDLLRTAWGRILGVDVADVHTEYAGNQATIKHWCNYVFRTFPGMHTWTGPLRWYGQYPCRKYIPESICPECGQPYRVLGWISKSDIDDWNVRGFFSGADPPWENDSKIVPIVKRRKYGTERNNPDDAGLQRIGLLKESHFDGYTGNSLRLKDSAGGSNRTV